MRQDERAKVTLEGNEIHSRCAKCDQLIAKTIITFDNPNEAKPQTQAVDQAIDGYLVSVGYVRSKDAAITTSPESGLLAHYCYGVADSATMPNEEIFDEGIFVRDDFWAVEAETTAGRRIIGNTGVEKLKAFIDMIMRMHERHHP